MTYYILMTTDASSSMLRADKIETSASAEDAVAMALGYDRQYARLIVSHGVWAWEIQPHLGYPTCCYRRATAEEAIAEALAHLTSAGYIYTADDLRAEADALRRAVDTNTMTTEECATWLREADALDALADGAMKQHKESNQ